MPLSSSGSTRRTKAPVSAISGFLRKFGILPSPGSKAFASLVSRTRLRELERAIGHRMKHPELLLEALLHRSYLPFAASTELRANERLEFLGDAVLDLVVAEYLFAKHPDSHEGELTVLRSRLVNKKALAYYAKNLKLRDFLITSASAAHSPDKGAETMLADAFEAVVGALFLDGGLAVTRKFVTNCLRKAFAERYLESAETNHKSALLEFAQAHGIGVPRYVVVAEEGPDHDRTFTVEVHVGEYRGAAGAGKNKKEAEQAAAERTLGILQAEHSRSSTKA